MQYNHGKFSNVTRFNWKRFFFRLKQFIRIHFRMCVNQTVWFFYPKKLNLCAYTHSKLRIFFRVTFALTEIFRFEIESDLHSINCLIYSVNSIRSMQNGEKVKVFVNHLISQLFCCKNSKKMHCSMFRVSNELNRFVSDMITCRVLRLIQIEWKFSFVHNKTLFPFWSNESRCHAFVWIIFLWKKQFCIIRSGSSHASHDSSNKWKQSDKVIIKCFFCRFVWKKKNERKPRVPAALMKIL